MSEQNTAVMTKTKAPAKASPKGKPKSQPKGPSLPPAKGKPGRKPGTKKGAKGELTRSNPWTRMQETFVRANIGLLSANELAEETGLTKKVIAVLISQVSKEPAKTRFAERDGAVAMTEAQSIQDDEDFATDGGKAFLSRYDKSIHRIPGRN